MGSGKSRSVGGIGRAFTNRSDVMLAEGAEVVGGDEFLQEYFDTREEWVKAFEEGKIQVDFLEYKERLAKLGVNLVDNFEDSDIWKRAKQAYDEGKDQSINELVRLKGMTKQEAQDLLDKQFKEWLDVNVGKPVNLDDLEYMAFGNSYRMFEFVQSLEQMIAVSDRYQKVMGKPIVNNLMFVDHSSERLLGYFSGVSLAEIGVFEDYQRKGAPPYINFHQRHIGGRIGMNIRHINDQIPEDLETVKSEKGLHVVLPGGNSTILHEAGHAIEWDLRVKGVKDKKLDAVNNTFKRKLSELVLVGRKGVSIYGDTNLDETFAEASVLYMLGRKDVSPKAKQRYTNEAPSNEVYHLVRDYLDSNGLSSLKGVYSDVLEKMRKDAK